jgi:hypothetical protein
MPQAYEAVVDVAADPEFGRKLADFLEREQLGAGVVEYRADPSVRVHFPPWVVTVEYADPLE